MAEYSYDKETNIITATHTGKVGYEEIQLMREEINARFQLLPQFNMLLDYRNATMDLNINTIALDFGENINEIPDESNNPMVRIACVPGSPENWEFNEFYQKMSAKVENFHYELFDSYEEAMEWLKKG